MGTTQVFEHRFANVLGYRVGYDVRWPANACRRRSDEFRRILAHHAYVAFWV